MKRSGVRLLSPAPFLLPLLFPLVDLPSCPRRAVHILSGADMLCVFRPQNTTMHRYAVVGHPIAHSRSPDIHRHFAQATAQALEYERLLAPLEGFAAVANEFFQGGGNGLNITAPFKADALAFADEASADASAANAANTLMRCDDGRFYADNTDGRGLLRDLTHNLGLALQGQRILLLGAGGAARGVLRPLLAAAPAQVWIANRSVERAQALAESVSSGGASEVQASGWDGVPVAPWDVVINATSAGLQGEVPPLAAGLTLGFGYDMLYSHDTTAFQGWVRERGAECADGWGMLVEQAAESFALWCGLRPDTTALLAQHP